MFVDENITDRALYGSSFGESYATDHTITRGGNEYSKLLHPYPTLRYSINLLDLQETIVANVLDFYHRVGGTFGGFRLKHQRDYSTNNYTDTPTFNDQPCVLVAGTSYQITRWYGNPADSSATRRRLRKPVAGSVLVGIRDDFGNPVVLLNTDVPDPDPDIIRWSVDSATGVVTLAANVQTAIEGISQAAQAVIDMTGHSHEVDDSVHISGVVGMVEINGLRGTVIAKTVDSITVDIDTSTFTAYASGGNVNTAPQANETVTAGCYFDIPVRFETDLNNITFANYKMLATSISIVEKLNP